ncbi:MAG: epoxyqueuosine reductase QueH [Patescibacteria group bacterium]
MIKIRKIYLVSGWALIVFILTSWPIYTEYPLGVKNLDKLVHFIIFAVLTYLLVYFFSEFLKKFYIFSFISILISASYSYFLEYLQIFIPGRFSSLYDFLAGFIGSLAAILLYFVLASQKPKMLLHFCCAGCGAYVSQELKKKFRIILYFYNPNIYPEAEYQKRFDEAKKIAKLYNLKLIAGIYSHEDWLKEIAGHELDPERGGRCRICYRLRLASTVGKAKELKINFFTSTLTVSPHKDANKILTIGQELEKKYNIKFIAKDFKKEDGFKKATALSKKFGLYRQNYCGCEFSLLPSPQRRAGGKPHYPPDRLTASRRAWQMGHMRIALEINYE